MHIAKIAATSVFVVSAFFASNPATVAESEPIPIAEPVQEAKATLAPALVPVCSCESTGHKDGTPTQYDASGNVVRGKVNHNDVGMCQINTQPNNGHVVAAEKMGLDLWTEQGNIRYANYLYEHEGLTPWNSSKGCWGK